MTTRDMYERDMRSIGAPKYGSFLRDVMSATKSHDQTALMAALRKFQRTWAERERTATSADACIDDLEDACEVACAALQHVIQQWIVKADSK